MAIMSLVFGPAILLMMFICFRWFRLLILAGLVVSFVYFSQCYDDWSARQPAQTEATR